MATGDDIVETLIIERGKALTGYAYLLCGDVHEAEDLVQDALVKTFTRRRAGLHLDSAEAYVRRAVLTLYLDGWRRRKRWAGRWPVAADPGAVDGHEVDSAARIDVVAALRALPRQQRASVVLRFYDDLTVPEIADRLGVSDGAVKRYLSLATRRLESLLGPVEAADTTIELVLEG